MMNVTQLSDSQLINLLEEINDELKVRLTFGRKIEPSSPILTREEIIKEAKDSIEKLKGSNNFYITNEALRVKAEFHINRNKRTVAVLLRGAVSNNIYAKGIAKCDPADTFNVHIGKAIALYRALGKPVPEQFIKTPQPETSEIGDIVKYCGKTYIIGTNWAPNNRVAQPRSTVALKGKVIDDSKE